MSLISRMRRQSAVYWQQDLVDEFGRLSYLTPVQIKCRWDDMTVEFIRSDKTVGQSRGIVYVDRDMKPGDKLLKGTLADIIPQYDSNHSNNLDSNDSNDTNIVYPTPNDFPDTAWEVLRFENNPNLKNTDSVRTCYL